MQTETEAPKRLGRPPLREAAARDSLERARKRAEEIRDHLGGDMDEGPDMFHIDVDCIPEGWTYEFKRFTLTGKEDPTYQVNLARRGWTPVERTRHPEMMPKGSTEEFIIRDGQILMERPSELTREAQENEKRKARHQIQAKEEQMTDAKPGHFERNNKGKSMARIKKEMGPIEIPD